MKLSWREGEEVSVADEAELDRALDNIERAADHELPMISLTAPPGSQLHAGIGNEDASTLVYFPPGYDGVGSLHSVGDRAGRDRDDWSPPLTFYFFGHHSEFAKWSGIPIPTARKALRSFLASNGKLPPNVEWEED